MRLKCSIPQRIDKKVSAFRNSFQREEDGNRFLFYCHNYGCIIAHLNVRSILNKMDDVRSLIHNKRFDIFTFSETSLNPSIKESELNIPGYTLVRHDRTGKRGGSTGIYVRNNIPYKHRQDLSAENIESSWIKVSRLK